MHIHILGICGTFMGGLAALAREAGHRVTGCDTQVYPPMSTQLNALGIELLEGYGAEQLALQPDVFVVGNVVSRTHLADGLPKFPLMEAILNAGARYTSGPQWLAEQVLHQRHVLAVAGTHGKTTTTAMLAWVLEAAGLSPGFLIGGVPLDFGISARLGQQASGQERALFVIEADEYDTAFFDKRSKFVHYRPRTAVLNNLEFDHADIFDDVQAIERQFHHLIRTIPAQGRIVVNGQATSLARVLQQGCWSERVTFGAPTSDWTALGDPHDFAVCHFGQPVAHVRWDLSGTHNQCNALAAIAAAVHVGVPAAQAGDALSRFQGVKRRMELRGSVAGIHVYDDFAHHPTALRTTLDGLRRRIQSGGRILAVFEPRSNTMQLGAMKAQLPAALEPADRVFCHTQGLAWDAEQALAPLGARVQMAADVDSLVVHIVAIAQPGDHIVCMSNGSFGGIHERLLVALSAHSTSRTASNACSTRSTA